ncbi:hypothetical protein HK105_207719 [Polyrhizophydium stewartii]|uniref:F-box domain-containing protein n=1 Tax=Polyrhizophydium stewartii TaxID=2732419 RepID=A0ABR4MZX4_9FUNG|nr:hypothetical protein HK105_001535 [Polyrhizophydium stewartii]
MQRPADLPPELELEVLKRLDAKALSRYARASDRNLKFVASLNVWASLLTRRFGKAQMPSDPAQAAARFRELHTSHSTVIAPSAAFITWMDDSQYWNMVDDPNSTFGRIAVLSGVWWFDIRGTMLGVPAGSYRPVVRYRSRQYLGGIENVRVSFKLPQSTLESAPPGAVAEITDAPFNVLPNRREWTDLVFDPIDVGSWPDAAAFHDVEFVLEGHDGSHKSGFALDCIFLHPVAKGNDGLRLPVSGEQARDPHDPSSRAVWGPGFEYEYDDDYDEDLDGDHDQVDGGDGAGGVYVHDDETSEPPLMALPLVGVPYGRRIPATEPHPATSSLPAPVDSASVSASASDPADPALESFANEAQSALASIGLRLPSMAPPRTAPHAAAPVRNPAASVFGWVGMVPFLRGPQPGADAGSASQPADNQTQQQQQQHPPPDAGTH